HRLDGARRADRGADAAEQPAGVPARRTRARNAAGPRDLGPRPALHRARVGVRSAVREGLAGSQAIGAVAGVSAISSRLISVSAAMIAAAPKNASAQNA